jgi:hypothetical protein
MIVEVGGASMEPSLRRSWRVRVAPAAEISCGDVILFKGRSALVLHRVVGAFDDYVVHRGDAGGGMGLVRREEVLGRAIEVVSPPEPFPDLDRLPPPVRASFARARRRARAYAFVRRIAVRAGLDRTPLRRLAAAFWRRA